MTAAFQRTLFCSFCDEPATTHCEVCRQSLCSTHAEPIGPVEPEKTIETYACPSCLDSFDAYSANFLDEPFPLPGPAL